MTKQTAISKGLVYLGHYHREKSATEQCVADYRARGYKAYVVTAPDSPYSRGPIGTGYCVYGEKRIQLEESAAKLRATIQSFHKDVLRIQEEAAKKIADRASEVASAEIRLAAIELQLKG